MEDENIFDESKLCVMFTNSIIIAYLSKCHHTQDYAGTVCVKTPDSKFISQHSFNTPTWIESHIYGKTVESKGLEAVEQCKNDIRDQMEQSNNTIRLQNKYGHDCPKKEMNENA